MKATIIVLVGCLGAAFVLAQGNLTPPGPPGPTMKSLDQIDTHLTAAGEKRIDVLSLPPDSGGAAQHAITAAGSYYLSGNLTGVSGKSGIAVNASNVTLDLNGFELVGAGGADAIFIAGGISNVTIHTGTIRDWGGYGINGGGNSKVRARDLRVLNNAGTGIRVDVNGGVVNCVAEGNVDYGIRGTDHCLIKDCQVTGTTGSPGDGIFLSGSACLVTGCIASDNAHTGISANASSSITGCIARANQNGIEVTTNCVVTGNLSELNTDGNPTFVSTGGIKVRGNGNRIDGNQLSQNQVGIWIPDPGDCSGPQKNVVIRNTAANNTSVNYAIMCASVFSKNDFGSASAWTNFSY